MDQVCAACSGGPKGASRKLISAISGSQICRCGICGAFWLEEDGGQWEMILPPSEIGASGIQAQSTLKQRSA